MYNNFTEIAEALKPLGYPGYFKEGEMTEPLTDFEVEQRIKDCSNAFEKLSTNEDNVSLVEMMQVFLTTTYLTPETPSDLPELNLDFLKTMYTVLNVNKFNGALLLVAVIGKHIHFRVGHKDIPYTEPDLSPIYESHTNGISLMRRMNIHEV